MPQRYENLAADDEATTPITVGYGTYYSVSVWGTWTGEVEVQRSFNGMDWSSIEAFTDNFERDGRATASMEMRIKANTITSGTAYAAIFSKELKVAR